MLTQLSHQASGLALVIRFNKIGSTIYTWQILESLTGESTFPELVWIEQAANSAVRILTQMKLNLWEYTQFICVFFFSVLRILTTSEICFQFNLFIKQFRNSNEKQPFKLGIDLPNLTCRNTFCSLISCTIFL